MNQSNRSKMFAFSLRVLGTRLFSPPARVAEGDGCQESGYTHQAQRIDLKLEVCCSPFSQPWPKPDGLAFVWPRSPLPGEVGKGEGVCFLWVSLAEKQTTQERRRQSSRGTFELVCRKGPRPLACRQRVIADFPSISISVHLFALEQVCSACWKNPYTSHGSRQHCFYFLCQREPAKILEWWW